MTERRLLSILEPVLEIIKNQDFKDPQHRKKVERLHEKVTCKLLEIDAGAKVMQLRFKVNTTARIDNRPNFMPTIVDELPVVNSIAGWINEPDGSSRSIERELVGRTYGRKIGHNLFVISEYFRSEGDQDPLFQIARRHHGLTGIEGVVTRKVYRKEAEALLFTGYEEHEKAEAPIFKPIAGELVVA